MKLVTFDLILIGASTGGVFVRLMSTKGGSTKGDGGGNVGEEDVLRSETESA